jgi:hypothetical protein
LTEELIDTLAEMLRVLEASPSDAELGGCDAIAAYSGYNHLPLLCRFYRSYRPVLFRLARTLASSATANDRALLKAPPGSSRAHEEANGDWLALGIEVDLLFASEQWQQTTAAGVDGRRQSAAPASWTSCKEGAWGRRPGHLIALRFL